ncbi:ABC transporter substrate-binding protein [Bradyrhizobium sp. AZCC 2289]|jgi:putative ABC transport system substrate-binding protein|uniref:ABC transporter substrate-binding protein n=1 Tax=Bradyrhizobium sp. AZCC 2289 TaxID=3117026 RepID=UPI002FF1BA46
MRRREFITLVGGAAAVWPIAARAQAGKLPTIGFLGVSSAAAWEPLIGTFERRLQELGWIEERTVVIERRWADGRNDRFAEIAAEFVRLKVDVIITAGSAVPQAKQATSTIPIVFAVAADPLGAGLVASLGRPGGNVTGLSLQSSDLAAKRLELLRSVVPGLRRLAVLANVGYIASEMEMRDVQTTARTLGIEADTLEIRRVEDIEPAFDALKGEDQALYVCIDALVNANGRRINSLALNRRLPTMLSAREFVAAGGLISYGPSYQDLFRRAAEYADKILRGARPGDLPVEQPTKFELVVNLKTAQAIGISLPPNLLAIADEVIE